MNTLEPCSGVAFRMAQGSRLEVLDPNGSQVSDLFCVDLADVHHRFSASHTLDYADRILLTRGDFLYSNQSERMLEIVSDDCRRHDLLMPPCSERMFQIVEGNQNSYLSCHGNLARALEPFGVKSTDINDTFNIFMNVQVDDLGRVEIHPPLSKAGDRIEFLALQDLIVGLTACSHPGSNAGVCKPIQYRVLPDAV